MAIVNVLWLTLALQPPAIHTCADNHDIVDYGEAALAAYIITLPILDTAVRQDGSFVHSNTSLVYFARIWQLFRREILPCRVVDDLVWRVSEYVDNRVGRVKDSGVESEVWKSNVSTTESMSR